MVTKIVVDRREPDSIVRSLKNLGCQVYKTQLKLGDYVTKQCIIERKTVQDFEQSIIDGRLFTQVEELAKCQRYPFIIVTGKLNLRRLTIDTFYGAIASVYVRYGIPILYVETDVKLSYLVAKVLTKMEKAYVMRRRPTKTVTSKEEKIAKFLQVSLDTVKRLFKKYGSLRRIAQLSEDELREVKGIGAVKARYIYRLFNATEEVDET